MADSLGNEFWLTNKNEQTKRGVKRNLQCAESSDEHSSPSKQPVAKSRKSFLGKDCGDNTKRKYRKKSLFTRRRITDEDLESLNRPGNPRDVNTFMLAVVPSGSHCEDETNDSRSDTENRDVDMFAFCEKKDFLPPNEGMPSNKYLSQLLPMWKSAVVEARPPPASPLLLILCSSAIRAVQLNRDLKPFLTKDCTTAKLFAKHMKLDEQKKFLRRKVCHAAIGTPSRVNTLLQSGSLHISSVHVVVLDWNWRDVKWKRMTDIPDIRRDLRLLVSEFILPHVKQTSAKIALL